MAMRVNTLFFFVVVTGVSTCMGMGVLKKFSTSNCLGVPSTEYQFKENACQQVGSTTFVYFFAIPLGGQFGSELRVFEGASGCMGPITFVFNQTLECRVNAHAPGHYLLLERRIAPSGVPPFPTKRTDTSQTLYTEEHYGSDPQCAETAFQQSESTYPNVCSAGAFTSVTTSTILTCSGSSMSVSTWNGNSDCSGSVTSVESATFTPSICAAYPLGSVTYAHVSCTEGLQSGSTKSNTDARTYGILLGTMFVVFVIGVFVIVVRRQRMKGRTQENNEEAATTQPVNNEMGTVPPPPPPYEVESKT